MDLNFDWLVNALLSKTGSLEKVFLNKKSCIYVWKSATESFRPEGNQLTRLENGFYELS